MALQDVRILFADRNGIEKPGIFQYSDYSFTSSMGAICSTFSITLTDPDFDIETSDYIFFYINNKLAFRGIVQKKETSMNKNGRSVRLSGKDTTLFLVEASCSAFSDFQNKLPKDIIKNLISQTNFIVQEPIISIGYYDYETAGVLEEVQDYLENYLENDKQNSNALPRVNSVTYDADFSALPVKSNFKISVGDRVYDKISELVETAKYNCLYTETGLLYIGDLRKRRLNEFETKFSYNIVNKKNNSRNNALSGSVSDDISDRYSTVTVHSQYENGTNITKSISDPDATIMKHLAVSVKNDPDPLKTAWQIRELKTQEGFRVIYELPGHVQGDDFWRVNRYVIVEDDLLMENKMELIVQERTFLFNENTGTRTRVVLTKEKKPWRVDKGVNK